MMADRKHAVLALEVTKAAFKALFPSASTRYEGLADLAQYAFTGSERWKERNSLRRQMEEGVDILTDRLTALEANEFRNLEVSEKNIALEIVAAAISNSTLTKYDLEVNKLLNSDKIVEQLEPECIIRWRSALLSETAVEYGRLFLREASQYMISLVRNLPEFKNDITWENYVLTRKLVHTLESSIASVILPRYRSGTSREVTEFEAAYSTDIIATFGTMELFGIDLPVELLRQPLDVAYITLTASIHPFPSFAENPIAATTQQADRFDTLLYKILRVANIWNHTDLPPQQKIRDLMVALNQPSVPHGWLGADRYRLSQPLEQQTVRDATIRLLITGRAGSGKTTAARWLAVQIASGRPSEKLVALSAHTPFVVQLRNAFRGSRVYPKESDLVDSASSHRHAEMPGNWIREKLAGGKAVVIFDGLDELSEDRRTTALAWIDKLIRDYPRSHFIITSRPEGMNHVWFEDRAFLNVTLQPMKLPDIRDCVSAWFTALRQVSPAVKWDDQTRSEHLLVQDIESRRPVQDLAETPLLCAMLCAYYSNNISDSAPRSRGELYGSVINVLVDARERRRGTSWIGPPFDLRQKLLLLQAVARYLTERQKNVVALKRDPDRYVMDADKSALQIIQERLGGMPTVQLTAQEALNYLTERSVIFQRIASNEAQFAHKTFQEYLAARDFALGGGVEELLIHVDDPTWRRIIAFAASVAPTDVASRLVDSILDFQTKGSSDSRETLLLAAECLSAASGIEPVVADKASSAIRRILPPRTDEEADLVAGFGEGILAWLEAGIDTHPEFARYCIRSAALIGGRGALDVISRYSQRAGSSELAPLLLENWDRFDPELYVQFVLRNLSLPSPVRIGSRKLLKAVGLLPTIMGLQVGVREGLVDLRELSSLEDLQELDLGSMHSLRSLEGVESMVRLKKLGVAGVRGLSGVERLSTLAQLEELYFIGCSQLFEIDELRRVRSLKVLHLSRCVELEGFEWIGELNKLWTLDLSGCDVSDLGFCSHLLMLRTLRARVATGVRGVLDLSGATYLRLLTLKVAQYHQLALPASGCLRTIVLSGHVTEEDLEVVGECNSLAELVVEDGGQLRSVGALANLRNLRRLVIRGGVGIRDVSSVANMHELESLELPGCDIENVDFVQGLERLSYLKLDGCKRLSDISRLGRIGSLQFVSLLDGVSRVDESEITRAAREADFEFEHDSFDPQDYLTR
jgi:Leucine-rich repeat (LRR) protein